VRLFVKSSQVKASVIGIPEDQFHYLSRVLRLRKKEHLDIVIDETRLLEIEFLGFINKDLHYSKVTEKVLDPLGLDITLIQSLPKQNKFIDIIDHVTQIGVRDIFPIYTSRSIVKWDKKKEQNYVDKWSQRCRSAAAQSKQCFVPNVHSITSLSTCLDSFDFNQFDLCLVAWEEEEGVTLHNIVDKYPEVFKICILIGPEGGLSIEEVDLIKRKGFDIISIGRSIFRVEIAALVCMAQLLYCYDVRTNKC
jgi:16S rRNA (uracil1498-N3)-methyltransferase